MTTKPKKRKNPFLIGLAVLLPTLITIFVLYLALSFLNKYIALPLGIGVVELVGLFTNIDTVALRENIWVISLIGFPLAIALVFAFGYIAATYLGKFILKGLEKWVITRFPVISSIYPYAKQFSDLFFSESEEKVKFQKVVALEYPRPGVYQIGFVTSDGLKDLNKATGKKTISVFLPTSPTPFTGWTVFISTDQVIPLSLTVDEAIRLIVSGGVLIPPHQLEELKDK